MHIIDRRLNPGSKSLENRQRFLRRAKALVRGAVKKSSQDRDIKDVLEGGEVSIPLDGMNEPRFRREGGTRDMVLPGNKKFVEGDILPRSGEKSGGKPRDPGEGDSEDAFRFVLSRDEFVDLFLDDLELPDLAKRKLAEAESEGVQRAGYATSGSPANISISRTASRALARRVALRRPRLAAIEKLESELAECNEARRAELIAELDEETFFHGPASGGTLVSSALQAMHDIVRSRFRPADWNIYAAQASDGDNSISDGEVAGRLLTDMILPVSQFFAYLEVGEAGGYTFDMPDSALWTLYERLRAGGAPLSMRKVSERSEIFPVFHDLFHRRGKQEKTAP